MGGSREDLVYTLHAEEALRERGIQREWIELVVRAPALRIPDPDDTEVERFYKSIPENGDRVLRVAVNTNATPWRVLSAFFVRAMRGRL